MHISRLVVVFMALSFSGGLPGQDLPPDNFFKSLVARSYVEPFRVGDIDLWIQAFDENALALHNHRPMDRGRGAIEMFGRAVHEHFELREYEVEVTDVRHSDEWVYTVGRYRNHFVSKSDGVSPFGITSGKFVLLWGKQKDGTWKIILDMGNSNE